jgi:hypothetical protein
MGEAADYLYAALAQHGQALVGPRPVALVGTIGGDRFPQDRIADGGDAEIGDEIHVGAAVEVTGLRGLVAKHVAEADDRALDASPQFQRSGVAESFGHSWFRSRN